MKLIATLFLFSLISNAEVKLPSNSIYQLESEWQTQKNKKLNLKDLSGHPTMATMIFTSCPGACPLMVTDLQSLEKKLSDSERKKMRFILFSLDTVRDTPDKLEKFAEKMHLDERWTLLTGTDSTVREVAAAIGFQYKKLDGGDFTHSTTLFALSKQGVVLAKTDRIDESDKFIEALRSELK